MVQLCSVSTRSLSFNDALLIVGPSKINTHSLRQTDGERFFEFCAVREFSREFECHTKVSVTIKTQNLTSCSSWCDHVSSRTRIVCVLKKSCRRRDRSAKFRSWFCSRNKSEKGVAKKVSITIMRFPRWTLIAIISWSAACVWIVVKVN